MTTEVQTKSGKNGKHGSNARGVQLLHYPDRPSAFGVMWRERVWDDGKKKEIVKRKSEFFEKAKDRDARASALRQQRREGRLATASRAEIEEWRAFRAAIGNTQWQDVVAGWRMGLVQAGITSCSVTVEQAVKKHLKEMQPPVDPLTKEVLPGQVSPDTYRQKKHKLTLFNEQFGSMRLDQVTASEVEEWITDFEEVQSEATFNNYRKHVRTLFQIYVDSRMLRFNPVDDVKKRDDSIDEVGTLTPMQTARLLAKVMASDVLRPALGRLVLEIFAGLRFSSICRLEKKEINFADRGITLPKKKVKTGRRYYIDGLPENIWAWLSITPEKCWSLTPRQYLELKSAAFRESEVPHPANCFRHSFCTYHVSAYKNAGLTATILCHRNQKMLWDHYNGIGTQADGLLYFTITPATVDQIAQHGRVDTPPAAPLPPAS